MMEIFPSMYFSDNFFVYWKKSEKSVPPIFFLVAKDVAVLVVGKKTGLLNLSIVIMSG